MSASPEVNVVPNEAAARRILDDAWEETRRSCFIQKQLNQVLTRLPDISEAEAQRRSDVGRQTIERIARVDATRLSSQLALSLRLVSFRAQMWEKEAEWYWTVIDPLSLGFFGMFLPTAYCGGFLLNVINAQLAEFRFSDPADFDRYLALIADYARLLDQMAQRTQGQALRGMRMPKEQVRQSKALLAGLRTSCLRVLVVDPQRCTGLASERFRAELERRLTESVTPAFDRLVAVLADDYFDKAPRNVGIAQYSGGREIYNDLVRFHTTLPLTPEKVHAKGLERIAQIQHSMQCIRTELGMGDDPAAFLDRLNTDPRWRATTVESVTSVFQRYIERLKPRFSSYFRQGPRADYSVEPLPQAMQGAMTFGYYDEPRPGRQTGVYLFNTSNLTKQPLFNIGALTYHELVPGHHLHLCSQRENETLHPFHRFSFVNAYNEGWAEYAATLAGEIGMYEEPEERYGRLVMDAFLTCRLVVDTGMNALGWSLEQAREYMRSHSGMAEAEILTESLRYSSDIPGQALAYKLGDTEILDMRETMRTALGDRFDLKDFHAAVLGVGALPLPDLSWYLSLETRRLAAQL